MAKPKSRPIVVFNRPLGVPDFIMKAKGIAKAIAKYPVLFPAPKPALATFNPHIEDLVEAHVAVSSGTIGMVPKRNNKYDIVLKDIRRLQSYVQAQADEEPDFLKATAIIKCSGFDLRKTTQRGKLPLKAKQGKIFGTVELLAKAVTGNVRAIYQWQLSTDKKNWQDLAPTSQARMITRTLAPGKYYFRVRSSTSKFSGLWTAAVQIFIAD